MRKTVGYSPAIRSPFRADLRKTISLPGDLWEQVKDFRFDNRIGSEGEAFRIILHEGIKALAKTKSAQEEG